MNLFHYVSEYIYSWIKRQPKVKEESLTDWLLDRISTGCSRIVYQTFSRWEESQNGIDWEWWVLTGENQNSCTGYCFLVQAKKLKAGEDNYPSVAYSNKNGFQIDLLRKSAIQKGALPMYMFYSTASADNLRSKCIEPLFSSSYAEWCRNCLNGCFLSPADLIYKELFDVPRRKLGEEDILGLSLKLSLLDRFNPNSADKYMSILNKRYINFVQNMEKQDGGIHLSHEFMHRGIRHHNSDIPNYVWDILQAQGREVEWLQKEFRYQLETLAGVGVIDLRDTNHISICK